MSDIPDDILDAIMHLSQFHEVTTHLRQLDLPTARCRKEDRDKRKAYWKLLDDRIDWAPPRIRRMIREIAFKKEEEDES
tara:strand:+ start:1602 stop:1838 length:237 start_codon:yes stop_codon:yes gene_type:complete